MRLIEASPDRLYNREERAMAKLAKIAQNDTYNGGALAMVLAKRLELMGSGTDYDNVVSAVYTGQAREFLAFECPECDCVHLGQENALACCAERDDCDLDADADDCELD